MGMFDSDIRNAETQVELRKKEARENLKVDKGEEVSPDEMEEVGPEHQESTFRFDQNYKTTPEPSSKGYVDTKKPLEYRNDALQQTDGIGNVVKKNLPEGITLEDLGKNPTTGEEIPYYAPSGRPWTDTEKEAIKLTGDDDDSIEGITEADLSDINGYRMKKQSFLKRRAREASVLVSNFITAIPQAVAAISDLAAHGEMILEQQQLQGYGRLTPLDENVASRGQQVLANEQREGFIGTHLVGEMTEAINPVDETYVPDEVSKGNPFVQVFKNPMNGGIHNFAKGLMAVIGQSAGAMITGKIVAGGIMSAMEKPIEVVAKNMVTKGTANTTDDALVKIAQGGYEAEMATAMKTIEKSITPKIANFAGAAVPSFAEATLMGDQAQASFDRRLKDDKVVISAGDYDKGIADYFDERGVKVRFNNEEPDGKSKEIPLEEYDNLKQGVGNSAAAMNMPLLLLDNMLLFGKYIPGVSTVWGKIEQIASKIAPKEISGVMGKYVANKLPYVAKAAEPLLSGAMQANEEKAQPAIEGTSIEYANALMDKQSNDETAKFLHITANEIAKSYTDPESWNSATMAFASTMLGMPVFAVNEKYNPKGSVKNRLFTGRDYMVGGVFEGRQQKREYDSKKEQVAFLNKVASDPNFSRYYTAAVADNYFQRKKEEAKDNGDTHSYETNDNSQFINDAIKFHNAGKLNDFVTHLTNGQNLDTDAIKALFPENETALNNKTPDEIKRDVSTHIENLKSLAKNIGEINESVKASMPGMREETTNTLTSLLAKSKFTDQRIKELSASVQNNMQLSIDLDKFANGNENTSDEKSSNPLDYLGLKDKNGKTVANKFSSDVEAYAKKFPYDTNTIRDANLLVDYINEKKQVVKILDSFNPKSIDQMFKEKHDKEITHLQKIETERNKVDHHEEIRKDIEAKPEVIDLDEEGNPTQEKIERPEVTLDENEVIEESELPSEPASKRVANKTEAKSVLGKIQSAFNKVKLKGDQRLVRHGEKVEAYDRVTNAIKDESKEEIEFKAKKKELNDAETDRLINEAIDNGATEEDVAKIVSDRKEALSKEIETPSTKAGNIVDTFLRNYLLGTNDESLRSKFSPEAYSKIIEVAKKIKQEYSGWTLYPVDMFVHETEAKIGGVTDLIAMNSKGQIKVIDFKTRNTKEYKEGKKHQKQLSAYAIALNNTHGLDVIGTQIVDIPVDYDTEIENIATLTVDGIKDISFIDHDILQSVAGMKMKSFQDTTKGKDNGDDKNAFDQSSAYKNTVKYNPAERNRDLSNQFNFKTGETVTFKISPNNKENSAEKAWIDILLDGKFVGWLQFEGVDEIRKKVFAGENVKATITATQEQGFNLGQISTVSKLPGLKVGSSPKKSTKSIVSNAKGVIIGGLDKETGENTFMEQGYAYVLIPDNIDNPVFYTVKRAMNYQLKDIGTEQSKQVIDFLAETAKVVSGVSKENPFMIVGASLFDMVQAVSNITWESKANKAERSLALKQYENESIKKSKGPVKFDALFIIRDGSANVVRIVSSNGIFMITGGQVYEKIKSGSDFDYIPSNRDASELINEAAQLVRPQIGFGNTKVPRLVVAETKKDMDGNVVEVKGIKNDIDKWEFAETFITTDVRPAVEGGGFYAAPRFNFEIKSETKPAEVAVKKVNEVSVSRAKSIIERMKKLDMIKETGC